MQLLREQQPFLAAEFGVAKMGLFGSFATGRPDESSDVDIVVELERPLGFRFVDLVEYLEKLFGRKVDVLTAAGIDNIRHEEVSRAIRHDIVYV